MNIKNIGIAAYNTIFSSGNNRIEANQDSTKRVNDLADVSQNKSQKKTDTIELSNEALKIIEKKNQEMEKVREYLFNKQTAEHDMKVAQQQSESMEKETKNQIAMLKIMQRIANGDKVPYKDEKALMEYDSKMYQMAKMTAQIRKNAKPREYDSAVEDDKEQSEEVTELNSECQTASADTDTPASESEE